jgi:hypothetical protein
MRRIVLAVLLIAATATCASQDREEELRVPTGSDATSKKQDGSVANGSPAAPRPPANEPRYRDVTLPAGTVLPIALESHVASDTSRPEDAVKARLRQAVVIDGVTVLPTGSAVSGHVLRAERSGRVKGRARVAMRFDTVTPNGTDDRLEIQSAAITREARSTKKQDAVKIGGGAGAGALIGGIVGGKDGAAKGAAIGGGAGTAVVLGTRGEEIRLGPGHTMSVKLTQPLTVRVPIGKNSQQSGD